MVRCPRDVRRGLQLTAKRWDDARLLGVAKVLEKLLPPCPVPPNYA